jgi:very-long-chain enoyl-CoA reductase
MFAPAERRPVSPNAPQHVNALLVFGTMSSYLSGRAVATTKWNRARFGAAWPASRRHLIPFVF